MNIWWLSLMILPLAYGMGERGCFGLSPWERTIPEDYDGVRIPAWRIPVPINMKLSRELESNDELIVFHMCIWRPQPWKKWPIQVKAVSADGQELADEEFDHPNDFNLTLHVPPIDIRVALKYRYQEYNRQWKRPWLKIYFHERNDPSPPHYMDMDEDSMSPGSDPLVSEHSSPPPTDSPSANSPSSSPFATSTNTIDTAQAREDDASSNIDLETVLYIGIILMIVVIAAGGAFCLWQKRRKSKTGSNSFAQQDLEEPSGTLAPSQDSQQIDSSSNWGGEVPRTEHAISASPNFNSSVEATRPEDETNGSSTVSFHQDRPRNPRGPEILSVIFEGSMEDSRSLSAPPTSVAL